MQRAKSKPCVVPLASHVVGSIPHLALELLQASAGVKFLHVPYRGAAPAMTDLLGGTVQAVFLDAGALAGHIQGGHMRPLGAASDYRTEVLPTVPTLVEQGFAGT